MSNEHLSTEEIRHPAKESKIIKSVAPAQYGHLHVTFDDDTMDIVRREEHQGAELKAGDYWPPIPTQSGQEATKSATDEAHTPSVAATAK